jgi:hypothetical protein
VPRPSVVPASRGTTGVALAPADAGAGRALGRPAAWLSVPAGLPPTVATTTPATAPVTATRLTTTGTIRRRDGGRPDPAEESVRADRNRARRRPAALRVECIPSKIRARGAWSSSPSGGGS